MAKEGKKKSIFKRWWFWAGLVVLLIIIISASSSGGGSKPAATKTHADTTTQNSTKKNSTKKSTQPKKKTQAKTIGVGQPAKIDNVSFTVNKVTTQKQIKGDLQTAKASGKFVILDVSVKNNKKKSITIDSSFFKINTSDGTSYDASSDGDVMMAMGSDMTDFLMKQINPGLKKSGKIVFDVPANLDLSKAVLHCSAGFWGTKTVDIKLK